MRRFFYPALIRHYLEATPVDILHSPFVFDLHRTCVQNKHKREYMAKIEIVRNRLKKDTRLIPNVDFGAGSYFGNSSGRPLHKIVNRHAKPARIALILAKLIEKYNYRHILELGTSVGLTTSYLAFAAGNTIHNNIVTIEGNPHIQAIAIEQWETLQVQGIHSYSGLFEDKLPEALGHFNHIDMAFLDGNHRYQPTLDYFNQILPYLHNESVVVVDDIYWSEGMNRAWREICNHPSVTASIDYLFFGLIFIRKEQQKQNFRLRLF